MSDQQPTLDEAGISRTADGSMADMSTKPDQTQTDQTKTEEPAKELPKADAKTDAKPDAKDGKSLLNADDEAPAGAPEKYADFTLPEGVQAHPEKMAVASALFKELNIPQEGAQKLVDLYAKELTEAAKLPLQNYADTRKAWQDTVTNDPEIGSKLKEVRITASRAIDLLGPALAKQFREAMDLTGAGDHPAFVKGFYKLGQILTEGRHVGGSGPSAHGQQAPGKPTGTGPAAMYPNLPSSNR